MRMTMKRLTTVLILVLFGVACFAQQTGPTYQSLLVTAPVIASSLNQIGLGISYHKFTWNVVGSVSSCAVQLDTSPDNSTWTAAGAIASQNCATSGTFLSSAVVSNYVRINATAFSGSGSVTVLYQGYVNNPAGGGSMTWPTAAGIAVYGGSSAWGTSLTAPAGTIVGTSDTQTLTNKTLDGVTPATFGFLDATSSIQTQINSRLQLTGGTLTGPLITPASATGAAGFNLPHGVAPTTPNNGDLWTTTAGLFAQINGATVGPFGTGGGGSLTATAVGFGNGSNLLTGDATNFFYNSTTHALSITGAFTAASLALTNQSSMALSPVGTSQPFFEADSATAGTNNIAPGYLQLGASPANAFFSYLFPCLKAGAFCVNSGVPSADSAATLQVHGAIVTQAGTTYTTADSDEDKVTDFTSASAITVTVTCPSGTAFANGWRGIYEATGAGTATFSASGCTLSGASSLTTGQSMLLVSDGNNLTGIAFGNSGSGGVTSVGLALPAALFSVSGSPVTTTGTLTGSFVTTAANTFLAGPSSYKAAAAAPTVRAEVPDDAPNPSSWMRLSDDFFGSGTSSGSIGVLGWGTNGGTVNIPTAGVANHPGIYQKSTGTTISTISDLFLAAGTSNSSMSAINNSVFHYTWIISQDAGSTNPTTQEIIRCGLMANAAADPPTDGIYFENVTAASAANWAGVTRAASTSTTVASTTALDTSFHRFDVTSNGSGTITFYIDNTSIGTSTTNIPTGALQPACYIKNTEATAKLLDLDFFSMGLAVTR